MKEWKLIGNSTEVKAIYDGDYLCSMYQNILGEYKSFPECTWIRAKGPKEGTVVHVDYYYFRGHTKIFSENWNNKLLPNSSYTSTSTNTDNKLNTNTNNENSTISTSNFNPDVGPVHTSAMLMHESTCTPGPAAAASTLSRSVTAMAVDGIDGDLKCKICDNDGDNAATLLLCDLCDGAYHIDCLKTPLKTVPEDEEWHCDDCADLEFPFFTCWISLVTILYNSIETPIRIIIIYSDSRLPSIYYDVYVLSVVGQPRSSRQSIGCYSIKPSIIETVQQTYHWKHTK